MSTPIPSPAARAVARMPYIKVLRRRYVAARTELDAARAAMEDYRKKRKAAWFANLPIPTNGDEVFDRFARAERTYNARRFVYVRAWDDAMRSQVEMSA